MIWLAISVVTVAVFVVTWILELRDDLQGERASAEFWRNAHIRFREERSRYQALYLDALRQRDEWHLSSDLWKKDALKKSRRKVRT